MKKKKKLPNGAFLEYFDNIAKEKRIDREVVINAIKEGFETAYTKKLEDETKAMFNTKNKKTNNKGKDGVKLSNALVRYDIDLEKNVLDFYHQYKVVKEDDIQDDFIEISDEDPRAVNNNLHVGDYYEEKVDLATFTKGDVDKFISVFKQQINAAEKNALLEIFKSKIGEIVTGTVEKVDHCVLVNLGNSRDGALATLYKKDLIGDETFKPGDSIQVYVESIGVTKGGKKDDLIKISRSCNGFLKKLFFNEIHEIYDGTVEIVGIARIPGVKAKVSVTTKDPNVDPSGACIGPNGSRIQAVVSQLGNKTKEKVDVITFKENRGLYIQECLKPAQIIGIKFDDEKEVATVIVPDEVKNQAIGQRGVNAILTRMLLGLKEIKIIGISEAIEQNIEYKLFEEFEIEAREEQRRKTREESLRKANESIAKIVKEEEQAEDFLSKDEGSVEEEELLGETSVEPVVEETVEPVKAKEEVVEKVNVNTTISLDDLEASLEEEKKTTQETSKKKKKESKVEESKVTKEDSKPKEKMSIYTDEELEALENEEFDDDFEDEDNFEEYDDDSYYEE